jgi:Heterokaryon incompatibility protein (HET)
MLHHEICHQAHQSGLYGALPKPLLSVGDLSASNSPDDLKIGLTDDLPMTEFKLPSYAALSYCWGRPQAQATTMENITQRSEGFCSSVLNGTIRESVEVARALSIPYLWIDCLWIIQDSSDDKMHEIVVMSDIFARALVTIVAKSAAGVGEGFLKLHEQKQFGEIPYLCPDGR